MADLKFLAFDLGAESGRGFAGLFDGRRVVLDELRRFPNGPVRIMDSIFWDVLRLFSEMKDCIRVFVSRYGKEADGIGVDTWGVDFALLGKGDVLLSNPYHYRDKRTNGMIEEAIKRVPKERIFEKTGIQFMQINTLYQLLSMVLEGSPIIGIAETLLMMPDLFNFWLTGVKASEFTIATTSQFYNPREEGGTETAPGGWARDLLQDMGIPTHFLPNIIPSGTVMGKIFPSVAEEVGIDGRTPVVAIGCHDTASAVAAVPVKGDGWCYISSGTWSLMGVEVERPIINDKTMELNFTNEGGVGGKIRFLKNIMGLWLLQECRRTWARADRDYPYSELMEMAKGSKPFLAFVDPDDPIFLPPGDMPSRIQEFCRRTGQRVPETKGEVVRCALESLALKYRWVLEKLEEVMGRKIDTIHVVGGGSQNQLLCQLTADATRRQVIAGPVEATATGNVLVQALARGHIATLSDLREVVRNSFDLIPYEPLNPDPWDDAYERFLALI